MEKIRYDVNVPFTNENIYECNIESDSENDNFIKKDQQYINIIKNNNDILSRCGETLLHSYVLESLKNFTFGYINISKKISQSKLNSSHYKYLSSSSEEDEINYKKIKINGYIICSVDKDNILNINALFRANTHKGLGKILVGMIIEYCKECNINYCRLIAMTDWLADYYVTLGFIQTHRVLDEHYMELKI